MIETRDAPPLLLSRPVLVEDLDADGRIVKVVADTAECAALARFNGLVALHALGADLRLRPEPRGGVHVSGRLVASVVYTCVVTLDPFAAELSEPIDVHFLPEDALAAHRRRREEQASLAPDELQEEDEPDGIVDGRIDLGALVAEHLTLGLDPYPRRPGVAFVEPAPRSDDPDVSPFAALKALKNNTD